MKPISAPFLSLANAEGSTETPCPGEEAIDGSGDDGVADEEGKIYIFYGFLTCACITLLVGLFWVYLTVVKVLDPIREDNA